MSSCIEAAAQDYNADKNVAQVRDSFYYQAIAEPTTSFIQLKEGYKIFSEKIGYGKIKILFVHGGPGNTHEYFDIFKNKLPPDKYELIFYDQLGAYYSDQPADTTLWNLKRCVEELEQVRQFYKLTDFYLLGHSFGGLLAMEYAVRYPNKLKGLIISNRSYSQPKSDNYRQKLYTDIGNALKLRSKSMEELKNNKEITDSIDAGKLVSEFGKRYLMRLNIVPEPDQRSIKHTVRKYRPYYYFRHGWDFDDSLSKIIAPTLLIGSRYDQVDTTDLYVMKSKIKRSEVYICPNGSHFAMWDDSENYFRELIGFINEVDNNNFNPDK